MGFAAPSPNSSAVNWNDFLAHMAAYVALAAAALVIGTVAGIPLGVAAAHARGLRTPILAVTNIGRVVPSLAVLTFMLPLFGVGFWPALAALAILAIPPIAITTDVALRSVPRSAIDAARGMGMSARQIFTRVEWPLALPIAFSGVRTAATEVIASAVLAAFIGAGGLGEYITTGLQANQPQRLWAGVAGVAALAIVAEAILALTARRFTAARA